MNHDPLVQEALAARLCAYAPYSNFLVGAAVLCADGRVFRGCNVENASYGLCNCAERTAFFSAIAAGCRPGDFVAMAVVVDTPAPASPCGACRQVIVEMGGPALPVVLATLGGDRSLTTAGELLPDAFTAKDLAAAGEAAQSTARE